MSGEEFLKKVIEFQVLGNHTIKDALPLVKAEYAGEYAASYPLEYVTRKLREYKYAVYRNEFTAKVEQNRHKILRQLKTA